MRPAFGFVPMFVAMGALSLAIIHELVELKIDVVTGAQEHVRQKKCPAEAGHEWSWGSRC